MPKKNSPVSTFRDQVSAEYKTGKATEHSYRPALKSLLEGIQAGHKAVNEPKRVKCGAPDFIVLKGGATRGHLEAKDLGESLDAALKTKQLKGYRAALPNLILTDHQEFRWFVEGKLRKTVKLRGIAKDKASAAVVAKADAELEKLLKAFLKQDSVLPESAEELARRLAAGARLIQEVMATALQEDDEKSQLYSQMNAIKELLLPELSVSEFSDIYAQTAAYGLFAARVAQPTKKPFSRATAAFDLPKTNPFLRKAFTLMLGPDLDDRVAWAVDELAEVLASIDFEKSLPEFVAGKAARDPVIHFYETFLTQYDPRLRETRGVYYTPEPVVKFIVRAVNDLLASDFKIKKGLSESSKIKLPNSQQYHRVTVLDPAVGTGTFLHEIISSVHAQVGEKMGGAWSDYVADHLLPRLFGFELLMAPYAVAHMKLGLKLSQTGYDFATDQRLGVYLTNTLTEAPGEGDTPAFAEWLAVEGRLAGKVKNDRPVMVILGNPPYSGHSANKGAWIEALLKGKDTLTDEDTGSYFAMDGKKIVEKQLKWLHDDYVKFFRFAQWRIERTGTGIVAFISNNGFIDNPTFRAMRRSLGESFDKIYVINLHGSVKKGEVGIAGEPDENVFDIQQGVAITLMVKTTDSKDFAEVQYCSVKGPRVKIAEDDESGDAVVGGKYMWLQETRLDDVEWETLTPQEPSWLLSPPAEVEGVDYDSWSSLFDIFPEKSVGIVSARDGLTMHFREDELEATLKRLQALSTEDARAEFKLGADARDWKVASAQGDVAAHQPHSDYFARVLYRPFNERVTFYTGQSRGFIGQPQQRVMRELLGDDNVALCVARRVETVGPWSHVFATRIPAQHHAVSTKETNYVLPLMVSGAAEKDSKKEKKGQATLDLGAPEQRVNLNDAFPNALAAAAGLSFDKKLVHGDLISKLGREDVVGYIYAVLSSPSFRKLCDEALKADVPRVPVVKQVDVALGLVRLGNELLDLHAGTAPASGNASFNQKGSNRVERVEWKDEDGGRVAINDDQYFGHVPSDCWQFTVGGVQVCERWLKDRQERDLTYDEIATFCEVVGRVAGTIKVMARIDALISDAGGWATVT